MLETLRLQRFISGVWKASCFPTKTHLPCKLANPLPTPPAPTPLPKLSVLGLSNSLSSSLGSSKLLTRFGEDGNRFLQNVTQERKMWIQYRGRGNYFMFILKEKVELKGGWSRELQRSCFWKKVQGCLEAAGAPRGTSAQRNECPVKSACEERGTESL